MADRPTSSPRPRAAVADPALSRPNRLQGGYVRPPETLKLDWNENTDPVLIGLVGDILKDIPAEIVSTYPSLAPLYRKLAAHLGVAPECLAVTAGSEGAIRQFFEAYVDPGDTVALTEPTFGMYSAYARMFGAAIAAIPYRPGQDGPELDAGTVIDALVRARPKLFFLPNPDSPTGTVFPPAELRAIVEAAADTGTLMVIDEAYYPFYPETAIPWVAEHAHLAVLRSTSKSWALAGLRIGYAIAAPEVAAAVQKVRPMFEINSLAAEIFSRLLDHVPEVQASVRRLEDGKKFFRAEMDRLGFKTFPCQGNFQHVGFGARADAVHAALAGHVLYREKTDHPCLEGFSRFSATTVERFQPIVGLIAEAVGAPAPADAAAG